MEVILTAASNWGHPDRIGLTDVQFFDRDGKRISLSADQVKVDGQNSEVKGDLGCIVNGKAKVSNLKNIFFILCMFAPNKAKS